MDPTDVPALSPARDLARSYPEPRAAAVGAAGAGLAAGAGAVATYVLFASGLMAFEHPFTLAVAALVTPVFMAIPAARLAAAIARRRARRSAREAAAAAAGSGAAATLVALGAMALIPSNLVEAAIMTPAALGAAAAVGLIGARAFTEVPEEETPALYLGLLSAGLNGAHLAFWGALLAGVFSLVAPGYLPGLFRSGLPSLFPTFAAATVGMAALAPASLVTARVVGRARKDTAPAGLIAGMAAPLAVPAAVSAALAVALQNFQFGAMSAPWQAATAGFVVGTSPHFLALYLGLMAGRREAGRLEAGGGRRRALPALAAGSAGDAAEPDTREPGDVA